jgi:hypothetical protein
MPYRNRVTPYGDIVVSPLRGEWMGNRGCLHRGHDIVRPWNGKRWITCALDFRGWVAPKWATGRWTALFFYDEAVALAAGHRPCALCRRSDYLRYCTALGMSGADLIDARLHADRLDGRRKRLHTMGWRDVPAGAFVDLDDGPALVADGELRPWSAQTGYGEGRPRPANGDAVVITPAASIVALRAGYASPTVSLDS